jgi:hypothetical protein
MSEPHLPGQRPEPVPPVAPRESSAACSPCCPVCGGSTLIEIRAKLTCQRCRAIIETCCEGGRG